jgi:hypothetical protein
MKCHKYGGECIGCGECDFERKYAHILEKEDIDQRIEEWRALRKQLSKRLKERK